MKGVTYALIGLGLSLIFGVMRVCNLAHGEFFMIGSYIAYFTVTSLHLHPIISILISTLTCFLIGMLSERILIPLRRYEDWTEKALIVTIGISLLMQNIALNLFGAMFKSTSYYVGVASVFGINISFDRLNALLFGTALILTLHFLISKTLFGKALRAVSQNKEVAEVMGINSDLIYMVSFGIATALAGSAGALLLPITSAYPTVGIQQLMIAFIVIIVGGMGSIKGTTVSGIIIGILEGLTTVFYSVEYSLIIAYVVAITILLFRPSGLFGRRE
jgi:branched-chain amino acid transport system permease protein